MGGAVSTTASSIAEQKKTTDENEVLMYLFPIYYTAEPLLPEEQEEAIKAWRLISNGQSPEFFRLKKTDPENTPCRTPMEYFGNRFYKRLLEVHPTCQGMFTKTTMKQGSLLLRMISFAVSEIESGDNDKFDRSFSALAHSHNKVGVKAVEYGIFGEVLFYTLRCCLGPDVYKSIVHRAWIKIYSRMLFVILPIVVRFEMANKLVVGNAQIKRMTAILDKEKDKPSNTDEVLPADALQRENSTSTIESRMVSVVPP